MSDRATIVTAPTFGEDLDIVLQALRSGGYGGPIASIGRPQVPYAGSGEELAPQLPLLVGYVKVAVLESAVATISRMLAVAAPRPAKPVSVYVLGELGANFEILWSPDGATEVRPF